VQVKQVRTAHDVEEDRINPTFGPTPITAEEQKHGWENQQVKERADEFRARD
jgi:hypothetical protein